jgi:hypothetical protein
LISGALKGNDRLLMRRTGKSQNEKELKMYGKKTGGKKGGKKK